MLAALPEVCGLTGSRDAQFLPTEAELPPSAAALFPFSLREFTGRQFGHTTKHWPSTDTHFDPATLWAPSDFEQNLVDLVTNERLQQVMREQRKARGSEADGAARPKLLPALKKFASPDAVWPDLGDPHAPLETTAATLARMLRNGSSMMLQFERFLPELRPLKALESAVYEALGMPASIHLYCSAARSMVLRPHTDTYDVLVWQLAGEKRWRTCVPRARGTREHGAGSDGAGSDGAGSGGAGSDGAALSDAERCQLHELSTGNLRGCNTYAVNDTRQFRCEAFTMRPGDVLYMPKCAARLRGGHSAVTRRSRALARRALRADDLKPR